MMITEHDAPQDLVELTGFCIDRKHEGEHIKTFDWDQAVQLILKHDIQNAEAFLKNDEVTTSGLILSDGNIVFDHEAILESYYDTPTLRDIDTRMEYDCYKERPSTNWDAQSIINYKKGRGNK